jgi:hypothetical protein
MVEIAGGKLFETAIETTNRPNTSIEIAYNRHYFTMLVITE